MPGFGTQKTERIAGEGARAFHSAKKVKSVVVHCPLLIRPPNMPIPYRGETLEARRWRRLVGAESESRDHWPLGATVAYESSYDHPGASNL